MFGWTELDVNLRKGWCEVLKVRVAEIAKLKVQIVLLEQD